MVGAALVGHTVRVDIRRANETDADAVQRLRKHAWRARYAHPETGVTRAVLDNELAVMPPTPADIIRYREMLSKPANRGRNLVAVADGVIVGTVTYDRTDEGIGDIGVFVAADFDGAGVGDALLERLIASTEEPLQVDIFARNPSRLFYRRHGFREQGAEFDHEFRPGVSLPVQRLRLARETGTLRT